MRLRRVRVRGQLLAQEPVAAGERVLDVQPRLAARVRLLAAGAVNKNDPGDARSVAVAALRSPSCPPVGPADHAAVPKIWARRHRDPSRARAPVAGRLHAVLCELIPGGLAREIRADRAGQLLAAAGPCGAVQQARAELRRADALLPETTKKPAAPVRASGTSATGLFGAGPVIAATVTGDARDVSRLASRGRFAAHDGTAPTEASSGNRVTRRPSLRGNRRLNHAIQMAAITQIRRKHSEGRAYYDKKTPTARHPKRRCAPARSATPSTGA